MSDFARTLGLPPVLKARLKVPMDGRFLLRVRPPYHGRVFVGNNLVYDDTVAGKLVEHGIDLKAERPSALQIECHVDQAPDHPRTLVIDYQGPHTDWSVVPYSWVGAP